MSNMVIYLIKLNMLLIFRVLAVFVLAGYVSNASLAASYQSDDFYKSRSVNSYGRYNEQNELYKRGNSSFGKVNQKDTISARSNDPEESVYSRKYQKEVQKYMDSREDREVGKEGRRKEKWQVAEEDDECYGNDCAKRCSGDKCKSKRCNDGSCAYNPNYYNPYKMMAPTMMAPPPQQFAPPMQQQQQQLSPPPQDFGPPPSQFRGGPQMGGPPPQSFAEPILNNLYVSLAINNLMKHKMTAVDYEGQYTGEEKSENFRMNVDPKGTTNLSAAFGRDAGNGVRMELGYYNFNFQSGTNSKLQETSGHDFITGSCEKSTNACPKNQDLSYFDARVHYIEGAVNVEFLNLGMVNFYTGAGLGMAMFKFRNSNIKDASKLAYSATVGVNAKITQRLKLFAGYKYIMMSAKFDKQEPVHDYSGNYSDGRVLAYNKVDLKYALGLFQIGARFLF